MEHFMRTFEKIDLFLFDLDGLLVDTEILHWKAYQEMCKEFGFSLGWDYPAYRGIAGGSSDGIRHRLMQEIPQLFSGRTWEELYAIKKQKLFELVRTSQIALMPGVEICLPALALLKKPMVVVTHSSKRFVEMVQESHPVFSLITRWICREMYQSPKPSPDGYRTACMQMDVAPERAIGFEDTVRGIDALVSAGVNPVLVNADDQSARAYCQQKGIPVFSSLEFVLST
jgi:beta-phosphoglucomutase